MKTSPFPVHRLARPALALAALLVLSGCGTLNTIDARAKEKAATFNAATKWEQKTMREGWIDYGFTPDMVYIALDKPDKIVSTADGTGVIWVYNNYNDHRSFGGGVKVNLQRGSSVPGLAGPPGSGMTTQGISPNSAAGKNAFLSGSASPDLGAANVEPLSKLYVMFLHGKATHVELRQE